MFNFNAASIIGWLGMIFCLLAYWLISYRKVNPESLLYQLIFASGCLFFGTSALLAKLLPMAIFNVFMVVIAVYKICKIKKR